MTASKFAAVAIFCLSPFAANAQDPNWFHKAGSQIRVADDEYQVGIEFDRRGASKMVDVTTQKTFRTEMKAIDERFQKLEKSSQCVNEKYSQSCKDWPKETVDEMRKGGDYKVLIEELMKDQSFVEAIADALKLKMEKK